MTQPYIIAEMACSHDGSLDHARDIIAAAGAAGADAIQFQIWQRALIVTDDHGDIPLLDKIALDYQGWQQLIDLVRRDFPMMEIIACIYEGESLGFAHKAGVNAFKLHASDISNFHLLRAVAKTGKRIDLSIGGCDVAEILAAVHFLRAENSGDIWLMYGLQAFPTPPEDIDLAYLMHLKGIAGTEVGYQDHSEPTSSFSTSLSAAALGAGVRVLEKHITNDRSRKGADHQAALNPYEFAEFCAEMRQLAGCLAGGAAQPLSEAEKKYRAYSRKSVVSARALPKGHVLTAADIRVSRAPKLGIDPAHRESLIGQTLKVDKAANVALFEDDLA